MVSGRVSVDGGFFLNMILMIGVWRRGGGIIVNWIVVGIIMGLEGVVIGSGLVEWIMIGGSDLLYCFVIVIGKVSGCMLERRELRMGWRI